MSHLEEQDETYWEHCGKAILFALTLFALGLVCMLHAFIPNILTTTASSELEKLLAEMKREQDE